MADTLLQRELRQRRPFSSSAQEALLGLLRTADLVQRAISRVVEPEGVTAQQFNVLRILRGASPEPIATLAIGERMVEQTPGITRLLDRLEAKGLVRRQRCPNDRRQVHCFITPAGLALLASLDVPVSEAGEAVMRPIGRKGQKALIELMDTLRRAEAAAASGDDPA